MIHVVVGDAPLAAPAHELVVRVTASPARPGEATVRVADAAMGAAIAEAIRAAVVAAPELPVVRVRSRKGVERRRDRLPGAIAVVTVTERNARRLPDLVDAARAAGAAGVQIVWDGAPPAERHVFATLERARATPAGPPVVLATTATPTASLRLLAARRKDRPCP